MIYLGKWHPAGYALWGKVTIEVPVQRTVSQLTRVVNTAVEESPLGLLTDKLLEGDEVEESLCMD